jgi:hypothetical protein
MIGVCLLALVSCATAAITKAPPTGTTVTINPKLRKALLEALSSYDGEDSTEAGDEATTFSTDFPDDSTDSPFVKIHTFAIDGDKSDERSHQDDHHHSPEDHADAAKGAFKRPQRSQRQRADQVQQSPRSGHARRRQERQHSGSAQRRASQQREEGREDDQKEGFGEIGDQTHHAPDNNDYNHDHIAASRDKRGWSEHRESCKGRRSDLASAASRCVHRSARRERAAQESDSVVQESAAK